jgi:hypothetical protein
VIGEKLVYLLEGNLIDEDGESILVQKGSFIGGKHQFDEDVINEYFQVDHLMD